MPKAVVQTHRSFANTTVLYRQRTLHLTRDDITIAVHKLYFGYASESNLFFHFTVGASSVLFEQAPTPEALVGRINCHRATVLITVPSAVNQMLSHRISRLGPVVSSCCHLGREALPETLYHRWKEIFGVELLDGLGTAEMWHIIITNTRGDVRPGNGGAGGPRIRDQGMRRGWREPPGEVGRLWVRGDSLGLEYWESPEQTTEAFRGEWFVDGDLVSIDEDGYVTHRGRPDDAIKVKGKWFRPQEVESALLDHEAVRECALVAVTDPAGLAKPVAFVVRKDDVEEQELIDWVLARLEAYKHPRRIYFIDALPQTRLGKVDLAVLKRLSSEF